MSEQAMLIETKDIFQRSISAHLAPDLFSKLQNTRVLVAGLGGGSNIAELLARKGIGKLIIADLDRYEPHNIRQRGSLMSSLGKEKVQVMYERLIDINPHIELEPVKEGITLENVSFLVKKSDCVVDMLDLHAIKEKVALHRESRRFRKYVLTAPSVINGAVLWVFSPEGISFEEFSGYREDLDLSELASRLIKRAIPHFSPEAPEEMYLEAACGKRTLPLDAVGVDQASVLAVSAIENLALGRYDRVITVPRGIQVDVSDPSYLAQIVDISSDFQE